MLYLKQYSHSEITSCGIYKILNIKNNKFYVGSSLNFKKRKSQHYTDLKNNRHCNKHLQNAWNKYGEGNFRFEIIWICNKENRQQFEQKFLDILKPEYNILKHAVVRTEEVSEIVAKKLRKRYYIINPEGVQMCTDNLKEFCEDHNITRDNIAHLLVKGSSKRKYYQEWFITDDPKELKEENRYTKQKWLEENRPIFAQAREEYFTYMWNTKNNKLYVIGDDTKDYAYMGVFCKEFNLNKESIRTAFTKNKNNYKEWVIYREYKYKAQPTKEWLVNYYQKHKDFKIRKQRKSPYIYTIVNPQGETYFISKDIKGFCETHKLNSSAFIKVAKGKLLHHKNWKITRILK